MDKLSRDVFYLICKNLNTNEILNLSECCKVILTKIIHNNNIWRYKVNKDFENIDILNTFEHYIEYYIKLYKDFKLIEKGYKRKLVNLFHISGLYLCDIPDINLCNTMGHTDYIDFLKPSDLSYPVMKFIDIYDRPGISFKIKSKKIYSDSYVTAVFSLFKRYSDSNSQTWCYGTYDSRFIGVYTEHYKTDPMVYSEYPFMSSTICDDVIINLLQNKDTLFNLDYSTNQP